MGGHSSRPGAQGYLGRSGALTIGLGVLPVVAGLAALWRAPGEPRSRALSSFRSVAAAAIVCFGMYTAVKSTYVSTVFGTYTYERNLIYLAPLLFTGTALWLEHRFTKNQILEIYLNRVYLGAGAYGVDAAAGRYFAKSAAKLTLFESAVIAGLIRASARRCSTAIAPPHRPR